VIPVIGIPVPASTIRIIPTPPTRRIRHTRPTIRIILASSIHPESRRRQREHRRQRQREPRDDRRHPPIRRPPSTAPSPRIRARHPPPARTHTPPYAIHAFRPSDALQMHERVAERRANDEMSRGRQRSISNKFKKKSRARASSRVRVRRRSGDATGGDDARRARCVAVREWSASRARGRRRRRVLWRRAIARDHNGVTTVFVAV